MSINDFMVRRSITYQNSQSAQSYKGELEKTNMLLKNMMKKRMSINQDLQKQLSNDVRLKEPISDVVNEASDSDSDGNLKPSDSTQIKPKWVKSKIKSYLGNLNKRKKKTHKHKGRPQIDQIILELIHQKGSIFSAF